MGHNLRYGGLIEIILKEMVDEKNHRGRPRLQYMSQIIVEQECNPYQGVKRKASDREACKLL